MTVDELVERLRAIADRPLHDEEREHAEADDLLLEFVGDDRVSEAFEAIGKWYA